ncbi:hypothetical protein KFK09_010175 [Dendrobium nobile]|uniref:Uncharacterized protein n=1 Tax=Dendrobium nobile TaxID=94219 RepID=A0A8T3BLI8_DENNO|nr:hypothetical protein KFK09_010175 [Dendrobium nobile]
MGFGRRSTRKEESYLHSQRAPVVASDQNVITSDPKGTESHRAKSDSHEVAEEATRANLYTSCEASKPNSKDAR